MHAARFLSIALIAAASVSAGSAFAADDGGLPPVQVAVGTATRAQVRAALFQAERAGLLPQGEARNYGENLATNSHGRLTRAEVRAEAIQALKSGAYDERS